MHIASASYLDAEHQSAYIELVDDDGSVHHFSGPLPLPQPWSAALEGVTIEEYSEPAAAVPAAISDRQFFQQLAVEGTITEAEALSAVKTGDIPAILQIFIDAITDPAERFAAEMLLSGATEFRRDHPLTDAIGLGQGRTLSQMDDFFRAAGAL